MQVRVQKLNKEAVIPTYSKPGDAGMDLVAVRKWTDDYGNFCYGTGLAFEIPEGYVGLIFPRSSISKQTISLCNSVGVIDSGYRGEVILKFKPTPLLCNKDFGESSSEDWEYNKVITWLPGNTLVNSEVIGYWKDDFYDIGDRIGQIIIIPYPQIELVESEELTNTERGTGGFGHTGK